MDDNSIPSAPDGQTSHYELRNDGYYMVWGADFSQDEPGERKLLDHEVSDLVKELSIDIRNGGVKKVAKVKPKIQRIVNQIKRLSVEELKELNEQLKDLGMPPVEPTGVPAKPNPQPPSRSSAAVAEKEE